MKQLAHSFPLCHIFLILATRVVFDAAVKIIETHHLEDRKFAPEEYEDPEIEGEESGQAQIILPVQEYFHQENINRPYSNPRSNVSDKLSPNIKYDPNWPQLYSHSNLSQISAVSIDPKGNVAIFHRGDHIWNYATFGDNNVFMLKDKGPIQQSTIILYSKTGRVVQEWGRNMFYMPHGLTIDSSGNYWVTDVAMHQVFKFDAKSIDDFTFDSTKPSMTLGEAFQPGNDAKRFCKPTAVAVESNGDFFVSDGYCNSRVIKFNKNGERILTWGRNWGFPVPGRELYNQPPPFNAFLVPHALALAEEYNYIFIADRENARVVCSFANNGTIHKVYNNSVYGDAVYSIAYANDRLYLVNGNRFKNRHVRGYVLDIKTGAVLSQFAPMRDMLNPHDIAVTPDEREIYVVELNEHKIYKFNQDVRSLHTVQKSSEASPVKTNVTDFDHKKGSQRTLVVVAVITALFFIGFCIFLAALLAKYQKKVRRRRPNYSDDKKDDFKLSNLFDRRKKFNNSEGRPNTREFSKVNTEPETSDDENIESNLEKIV